jgi:hypothetical protein
MPLWAVQGDPNTDGDGALIATNPQTVFVSNIPVIVDSPDHAEADDSCPGFGHCDPYTAQGSPNVFAYNIPVHRHDDLRICEARTVVINQNSVFVNDGAAGTGLEDEANTDSQANI